MGNIFGVFVLFFSFNLMAKAPDKVFFVSPQNGQVVSQNLKVKFGQHGLKVQPAGTDVDDKTKGHFHILIDKDFIPDGQVIPADANHLHYGKAQLEADITLTPGVHKLTLQFADGAHRSLGKSMSQTISVTVK